MTPEAMCQVAGCDRLRTRKLYCNGHYQRLRKFGDVQAGIPLRVVSLPPSGATCTVDDCARKPKSRGWCDLHYQRWQNNGDPLTTSIIYGDDEARFWSKVDKDGPTPENLALGPCWPWLGFVNDGGYGWFKADGRMQAAHRWAFSHFIEPVPTHLEVDHLCFVRSCVNFERHLEIVTPKVNSERKPSSYKATCSRGHPMTDANSYRRPEGGRRCRTCTADNQRAYQARKSAGG